MYCNICGKENSDGKKFCKYCGNQLTQKKPEPVDFDFDSNVTKETSLEKSVVEDKSIKKDKKEGNSGNRNIIIAIVILSIVALALAVGLILLIHNDKNNKTENSDKAVQVSDETSNSPATIEKAVEETPDTITEEEQDEIIEQDDEEEKDPVMEKVALKYLKVIDDFEATESGSNFNEYKLVNITPSEYPELALIRRGEWNTTIQIFGVNYSDDELIDYGDFFGYTMNSNQKDMGYYEYQNIVANFYEDSHFTGSLVLLYYLSDEGKNRYKFWEYGCEYEEVYDEPSVLLGYYTSLLEGTVGDFGAPENEFGKTLEECEAEFNERIGGARFVSFKTMEDGLTKYDMIKQLESYLSRGVLESYQSGNAY